MDSSQLSAQQITETLHQVLRRFGERCHMRQRDAIEEAARSVRQHEQLVRDVLPDLRTRLAEANGTAGART